MFLGRLKKRFQSDYDEIYAEELPYYEPVPEQQYQQPQEEYYQPEEQPMDTSPLSILEEIQKIPSPKGTFPLLIGGKPVDLHAIEDYVVRISPFNIKTILRYHNARTIEEVKGYGRFGGSLKVNSKTILIILFAVGMAVLGILFIFFMPQIMQSFQAGI